MATASRRRGLRLEQRVDRGDRVSNRAHVAELIRLDLTSRDFLQAQDEIDGVDAVDLEIGVQMSLEGHLGRIDLKQLVQHSPQLLEYFLCGLQEPPRINALNYSESSPRSEERRVGKECRD